MKYNIIIEKPAEKFIMKLSRVEKERVLKAIYSEFNSDKLLKEIQTKVSSVSGGYYRFA